MLLERVVKNLPAGAGATGDEGLTLRWEDALEEERQPTPAFLLGNPTGRGAWRATIHGVTKESDMIERINSTKAGSPQQRKVPPGQECGPGRLAHPPWDVLSSEGELNGG